MTKNDPVNLLSEQFSHLKADDQASEILYRRANLEHLVDNLSPWELVALRTMVNARTPQMSSMSDLPSELVSMVAEYLTTKDALACAAVSKGWRTVWTEPSVAKHLVTTHFPELSALLSLPSSHPHASDSPWETFVTAAGKTIPRIDGKFISTVAVSEMLYDILQTKTFEMDEKTVAYVEGAIERGSRPSEHTERHFAYSSGRLAWHVDPYAIFIDDLRNTTRSLVTLPDLVEKGERDFVIWTMTENIIIFVDRATDRTMIVYHMDKKEFRRVTLPNRVKRITAHAEVAVLEFSIINPIYAVPHVFRWGTGLAKLQLPPFTRDAEDYEDLDLDRPEGFVFHPTESNVIYYFAHGEEDPFLEAFVDSELELAITVYKFVDLKYTKSFRHSFHLPVCVSSPDSAFVYVRYSEPITSHGLYGLVQAILNEMATPDLPVFRYNFDTLTETFSETVEEYELGMRRPVWGSPDGSPETSGGRRWNGQTYYLQKWRPHEDGPRIYQFTEWAGKVWGYSAVCVADESSTLVLGPLHEKVFYDGLGIEEIAIDDEFVVGMSPMGYMVWNFGVRGADREPWQLKDDSSPMLTRYTDADRQCPIKGCKGPGSAKACYICGILAREMDQISGVYAAMQSAFHTAWPPAGGNSDYDDEDDEDDDDDFDDDLMYGDDFD
ncbi:hypothetical protein CGCF415_v006458 [Colletotrichum fructicola]|uniref:F-box domain-containing protein n=1 Tax=Colletotrichum fructicola (strain Nara gc5) TaxID=1213859 RepID=L2FJP3_COLFN|nr:uncharacterized protein CGMCC3_g9921 [Colletotrichum fructicola]KAF4481834.1 hypothetical protein CGGC5_v009028 [Colletotrichum fructicola Nara gc5]KAE9574011.1 hypothetical protein CGMCC3_g9921 [Colletotrichum fructicola]KAF4430822.1 hypothetical protein CFRS1_v009547 [Colletotrichum fructicola]KAF4883544.1 hypothetical protein CGCFRS4_v013514 [Colletotrichum fructicola]KAF4908588.1 hypothetical protein CGCF415_v006458 [Colletotrichum fructicola]